MAGVASPGRLAFVLCAQPSHEHCTELYCALAVAIVLHYAVLYCTPLYCFILYCTALHIFQVDVPTAMSLLSRHSYDVDATLHANFMAKYAPHHQQNQSQNQNQRQNQNQGQSQNQNQSYNVGSGGGAGAPPPSPSPPLTPFSPAPSSTPDEAFVSAAGTDAGAGSETDMEMEGVGRPETTAGAGAGGAAGGVGSRCCITARHSASASQAGMGMHGGVHNPLFTALQSQVSGTPPAPLHTNTNTTTTNTGGPDVSLRQTGGGATSSAAVAAAVAPAAASSQPQPQTCIVCFEQAPAVSFTHPMPCGHPTCDGCWVGVLRAHLDSGDPQRATCPMPHCALPLPQVIRCSFGLHVNTYDGLVCLAALPCGCHVVYALCHSMCQLSH